jgi:hypothetical protein
MSKHVNETSSANTPALNIIEQSPQRLIKAAKLKPKVELSSFQRHEALVLTDNSDRYAQWPKVSTKKHDVEHKIGKGTVGGTNIAGNGIAADRKNLLRAYTIPRRDVSPVQKTMLKADQKIDKKQSLLGADPDTNLRASRAPLVQKRVAVLRNGRNGTSDPLAVASTSISSISKNYTNKQSISQAMNIVKETEPLRAEPIKIIEVEENKNLKNEEIKEEKPANRDNLAMMTLLQQAEGLLKQVHTVRSYVGTNTETTSAAPSSSTAIRTSSNFSLTNNVAPTISRYHSQEPLQVPSEVLTYVPLAPFSEPLGGHPGNKLLSFPPFEPESNIPNRANSEGTYSDYGAGKSKRKG